MLQPPVPSLPPMAPASGSADHAVSGARSGRQVLPLAAAGFWTRLAGHGDDDSCPRDPGTPRWRRACSGECTCRAHGVALVVGEWCWCSRVTRPRSECYQGGQFHSHAPTSFQHDDTRLLRPQRASGPTSAALSTAHRCSDPAESPSQRKGQLAGLAHALSRARTCSRGVPGPSGRPSASLRPTRGALTTAAAA